MAFNKLTTAQLQALLLTSQDNFFLDKESGFFDDRNYRYIGTQVTTDVLQIRVKYQNVVSSDYLYVISNKTTISDGTEWSSFNFYEEV